MHLLAFTVSGNFIRITVQINYITFNCVNKKLINIKMLLANQTISINIAGFWFQFRFRFILDSWSYLITKINKICL